MKRMLACMAATLCFGTAAAQDESSEYVPELVPYMVQDRDTLWRIAGLNLGDPFLWKKIVDDNPFLAQPGRIFKGEDGQVIVVIKPGELLYGFENHGLVPRVEPLSRLQRAAVTLEAPPRTDLLGSQSPTSSFDWRDWWWLVILAAVVGAASGIRRNLRQDPVHSGPPVVEGGINDTTAPEQFQRMAAQQYRNQYGQHPAPQMFTIREVVRGRGYGVMNVRYRDGTEAARRLNGEAVYKARVVYPDGTERELYMLQACGNDVRYGAMTYLAGDGFRFVPEVAAQPEAAPAAETPVAAAPAVEQVPMQPAAPAAPGTPVTAVPERPAAPESPAQASEQAAPQPAREVRITYAADDPKQPRMLRMKGVDAGFTFQEGPDGITIRFRTE